MNITSYPVFALLGTLIFLTVLYGAFYLLKSRYDLSPEISRKMVHIGLGLTTLSFPWIFSESWPVWIMCGVSIITLLGLRHRKFRDNLGGALHSIERQSFGEICFPLSVAILFHFSHNEPVFYIVPLLVLTLADAFAAIVGVRYGQSHYDAAEGIKSIEGSLFFFITAFLCIQIPLLLMSSYANSHIILVALFIALLIMLCEAVSWQGLDNLFIPLGAYMVLTHYLEFSLPLLAFLTFVLLAIVITGSYIKEKTSLNLSALLSCVVLGFLYLTFEPLTFVIPLSMFVLYLYISRKEQVKLKNTHNVLTIFYLNLGGLFWLFLSNTSHYSYNLEFSIYFCIQMGVICWIHKQVFYGKANYLYSLLNSVLLFTALYMLHMKTFFIFTESNFYILISYLVVSLVVAITLFNLWSSQFNIMPTNRERQIVQAGSAFVGSVIFFSLRSFYA